MINVKDAGAKGDNSTDDWDVLDGLINDPNPQGALYFPDGEYRITKKLVFPARTGYHVVGCGITEFSSLAVAGARSAIVWDGPTPDTMVEVKGTGLVWDGVALWGQKRNGSNPRASVGLHIRHDQSTLSTGRMWLPAVQIDNCATGILVDGTTGKGASSCAFGLSWIEGCATALKVNSAVSTMFTFNHLYPQGCTTVFNVTNGGRIYTQCVNLLEIGTLLDVSGGDLTNSFFHLNGLAMDGNSREFHLLRNVDPGNGQTHVRITGSHFINEHKSTNPIPDQLVHVLIDRRNSTSGQTVLEIVGSRGLTKTDPAGTPFVLRDNVEIHGASASKPSRIIVRDSELPIRAVAELIKTGSQHFTENRLKNWLFNVGIQPNESRSG